MGIDDLSNVKKVLKSMSTEAFVHKYENDEEFLASGVLNKGYWIYVDGAGTIEQTVNIRGRDRESIKGTELVYALKAKIEKLIQHPDCDGIVFTMDLPDNKSEAKGIEYAERYAGILPDESDGITLHIDDGWFPCGNRLKEFKLDRLQRRQINYYIFHKLISMEFKVFDEFEERRRHLSENGSSKWDYSDLVEGSEQSGGMMSQDTMSDINNQMHEMDPGFYNSLSSSSKYTRTKTIRIDGGVHKNQLFTNDIVNYMCMDMVFTFNPEDLHSRVEQSNSLATSARVGEGEIAVFYHMHKSDPTCDKLVISVDSDALIIALLNYKDRISPSSLEFRDRVYVTMQSGDIDKPKKKPDVPLPKTPKYMYVDVNRLTDDICEHYYNHKHARHVKFPIETHCFLILLSGCDFVAKTYCIGKTHVNVFDYFMEHGKTFGKLVTRKDDIWFSRGNQKICKIRIVDINLVSFANFSHGFYCEMWRSQTVSYYGKGKLSPAEVTYHNMRQAKLGKYQEAMKKYNLAMLDKTRTKDPKKPSANTVPPKNIGAFNVFARNCAYVFTYWLNTYYTRVQQMRYLVEFDCARVRNGSSLWGYKYNIDANGRPFVGFADDVDTSFSLLDKRL